MSEGALAKTKSYTVMVLKPSAKAVTEQSRLRVWEHGRRNVALHEAGIMPIVCPLADREIAGIGIFNTNLNEAPAIMADDSGVRVGIFTVEVHICGCLPGDALL